MYLLRNITVSMLIIYGYSGQIVPFEKHGTSLTDEIPNSKLILDLKKNFALGMPMPRVSNELIKKMRAKSYCSISSGCAVAVV